MNKKYTKTEGNFGQGKSNNNQKNKKNINPKIYEISSKYINTVINTNSNNIIDSSKKRSENKNSVRKNRINFSKTSLNNEMKNYNEKKPEKHKEAVVRDFIYNDLENNLKEILGSKVNICDKNGKGKIEIEYYSKDDLDRIYELLYSINK